MRHCLRLLLAFLPLSPLLLGGSCDISFPGANAITVEVFNDTDLDVDPNIKFDDDPGFFAGLFPSDTLATGRLVPGETVQFRFACNQLGSIGSDSAEQFFLGDEVAEADDSDVIERGEEFDCGDFIRFRFVGQGDSFDVIVSVNGLVVD